MLARILYWLAVLIVSVALLVGLVLFFESRDLSTVGGSLLIEPAAKVP